MEACTKLSQKVAKISDVVSKQLTDAGREGGMGVVANLLLRGTVKSGNFVTFFAENIFFPKFCEGTQYFFL
jgi:hypothetical protein